MISEQNQTYLCKDLLVRLHDKMVEEVLNMPMVLPVEIDVFNLCHCFSVKAAVVYAHYGIWCGTLQKALYLQYMYTYNDKTRQHSYNTDEQTSCA